MFLRSLPLLLAAAVLNKSSATSSHGQFTSDNEAGMLLVKRLGERHLQLDSFPDICTGFELIIDEIPDGRNSCACDGLSVNCLFKAACEEGVVENPKCGDTVKYVITFENQVITIESCASISQGGFEETCALVSLAPDLQLDECLEGTYGGRPCDCQVCDSRSGLLLDCTAYDERAKTNCQPLGLGQLTPMINGFNTTEPPPDEQENQDSLDMQEPLPSGIEESASSAVPTTIAVTAMLTVAAVTALI
jgi:hypothetical protein